MLDLAQYNNPSNPLDRFDFEYKGKYIYVEGYTENWLNGERIEKKESSSSSSNNSTEKHECIICGKTEGTRQITAQAANGKWDEAWYCEEHYADAWQYYYGDKK